MMAIEKELSYCNCINGKDTYVVLNAAVNSIWRLRAIVSNFFVKKAIDLF